MKTIIAPTDFSDISLNAVNYAADMAADLNAELVIIHVVNLSSLITSDASDIPGLNYDEEWEMEELSNLQKEIIKRTENKLPVRLENLRGSVFQELKKFFEDEKPFAVIMATHCSSALARMFLQSVTLYTAKHIKYPVLIIPANTIYSEIKNIGLACDLKTVYHEPLEILRDWISAFHASLHVLHVTDSATNEHFGEMMLTRHYLKDFNPQLHYIENTEDVEKSIFSFAKENSIDLLIITPKKHETDEKSELKKFVLHPQLPLMTLQPL